MSPGLLDRKPLIRKAEDRVGEAMSRARNRPSKALQQRVPRIPNRNIGQGVATGAIEAGIGIILEDTLGIPFGGNAEVTDVQPVNRGYVYTVDVNAPTENMARARAFISSTTGFTSLFTDLIDVENVEIINRRTLRDTYQVEILVED